MKLYMMILAGDIFNLLFQSGWAKWAPGVQEPGWIKHDWAITRSSGQWFHLQHTFFKTRYPEHPVGKIFSSPCMLETFFAHILVRFSFFFRRRPSVSQRRCFLKSTQGCSNNGVTVRPIMWRDHQMPVCRSVVVCVCDEMWLFSLLYNMKNKKKVSPLCYSSTPSSVLSCFRGKKARRGEAGVVCPWGGGFTETTYIVSMEGNGSTTSCRRGCRVLKSADVEKRPHDGLTITSLSLTLSLSGF